MIDAIFRDLRQPEYLHVLINPLPVYGLGVALFSLIVALYLNSRSGQVTALIAVFACAVSAWPVAHYGEQAEDSVVAMADDDGQAWLKAHAHRADELMWVFGVVAVAAVAGIFVPKKWPGTARPLAIATLVLTIAALAAGAYIAHAGGKIRHKEFRNIPPPVTETDDN